MLKTLKIPSVQPRAAALHQNRANTTPERDTRRGACLWKILGAVAQGARAAALALFSPRLLVLTPET